MRLAAEAERGNPLPQVQAPDTGKEAALSFDELGNQLPLHVHRGALVLSLNVAPFDQKMSSEQDEEDENICGNCNTPTKKRPAQTATAASPSPIKPTLFLPNEGADPKLLVGYEAVPTSAVLDLTRTGANRGKDFFRPLQSVKRQKKKFASETLKY